MNISTIRMELNLFTDEYNFMTYFNNLEIKVINDKVEFEQAKRLLIQQDYLEKFSDINNSKEKHNFDFLYDGYDSYANHLIIKDFEKEKVIAYVRLIDSHTAFSIGGFHSENQFNLENILNKDSSIIELSHIVVDRDYQNINTFETLWSALILFAKHKYVNKIIGTLPLSLHNSHYAVIREIKTLKAKYLSKNNYRVEPYIILPPSRMRASTEFTLPALVDFIFNKGAKLCGDAAWNKTLNLAELFFFIDLDKNLNNGANHIPPFLKKYSET